MHTRSCVISDSTDDRLVVKISPRGGDIERYFDVEVDALTQLSTLAVTHPEVIDVTRTDRFNAIRLVRHTPLPTWLHRRTADERIEMRERLLARIAGLHAAGICHRDLQMNNVVVDGGDQPPLVDFELAVDSAGSDGCYDVFGPITGVEIPDIHPDIDLPDGIWWNAPWMGLDVPLIAIALGPVRSTDVPPALVPRRAR